MLFPGKKVGVGVSIEDIRGEKKLPIQYWFAWTDNTFSDKATIESDSGVTDTLVDAINSQVTKTWSEGTIGGQVYPNGIGFFLKALLGNVVSSGEDGIYEHIFTLLESNTHPTLTVGINTPLGGTAYALANIESMDFTAEVGGKFTVSINLKAKKGEEATHTVSYLDEHGFVANMLKVFIADNIAGLDVVENICLQSITVSFKKEIKDIECLSSVDPIDYINANFSIEGSMEMLFENNTYKDYFLNGTPKALRILAEDTKHPYEGVDNYPTFMLDLSKVIITDWTPAFTVDDITKQSISFKGHYDLKTKKALEIYLKNTQPSYGGDITPPEPEGDATYTKEEIRNQEAGRYEYLITRTVGNTIKTLKFYLNNTPSTEGLSWSILREKTENGNTITNESTTQVNILTWNWLVNNYFNIQQFGDKDWSFLWSFDLNTEYIHYYIQKLNDYDYELGQKYLDEEGLINPYPFTISHDNTLIKHGYEGNEIIAGGQDALDMINYVHTHENMLIDDNENLDTQLREMNRYSYHMNTNMFDGGGEYHIGCDYSGHQQFLILRNDNGEYSIINPSSGETTQSDSSTWDTIASKFSEFRNEDEYPPEATWINITNSQFNTLMGILGGSEITETTYEWTDDVL